MCGSIAEIYIIDTLCHDFQMFKTPRVYLDYAAATPLSKSVFLAMKPFLTDTFGNASAIHHEGVLSRRAVEEARARIAAAVQVRPEYVTFTSGGTESNNLAIAGLIEKLYRGGRTHDGMEVVTTRIEHPSIMATMESLVRLGVIVKYVAVDEKGKIVLSDLKSLLNEKTVLFSCAYANSEIGTIQELHAIKKELAIVEKNFTSKIFFHLDAAQAPLWLSCQFDSLNVDLLALDVGKCNGPKGVGMLVRSKRVLIQETLFGGGQESGLRPGTENVAGMVGASVALSEAQHSFKRRAEKVAAVRDIGIKILLKQIPGALLNGPTGEDRLANNINISIPGLDTEFTAVVLDKHGFAVSTKSACAGAGGGESVVVKEISGDPARSRSTLRFSLSPETTVKNISDLAIVLQNHIAQMQTLTKV